MSPEAEKPRDFLLGDFQLFPDCSQSRERLGKSRVPATFSECLWRSEECKRQDHRHGVGGDRRSARSGLPRRLGRGVHTRECAESHQCEIREKIQNRFLPLPSCCGSHGLSHPESGSVAWSDRIQIHSRNKDCRRRQNRVTLALPSRLVSTRWYSNHVTNKSKCIRQHNL